MATYEEIAKIERDATADPAVPPSGSTQQEVQDANALLARVRAAVIIEAQSVLDAGVPSGSDRAGVSALVWARETIDGPFAISVAALRLALANFSGNSVAQILAADDSTIQTYVGTVRATLSYGKVPNR